MPQKRPWPFWSALRRSAQLTFYLIPRRPPPRHTRQMRFLLVRSANLSQKTLRLNLCHQLPLTKVYYLYFRVLFGGKKKSELQFWICTWNQRLRNWFLACMNSTNSLEKRICRKIQIWQCFSLKQQWILNKVVKTQVLYYLMLYHHGHNLSYLVKNGIWLF